LESVAEVYFFPVSVLEAVMVTPGSGVLPLWTVPVIWKLVGAAEAGALVSGEAGV
jgi:hypothetical protein